MKRQITNNDKYREVWYRSYSIDRDISDDLVRELDDIVQEIILLIDMIDMKNIEGMVKQVILNSLHVYSLYDSKGAVICPRDVHYWKKSNPNNILNFTKLFITVLDKFEDCGLIHILTGNHSLLDSEGEPCPRTSIFFPTEQFIENYLLKLRGKLSISPEILPIYVHKKEVYRKKGKRGPDTRTAKRTLNISYPSYTTEKYRHNKLNFFRTFNSKKEEKWIKEYVEFINKFSFTLDDLPEAKLAGYKECKATNADVFANPQFRRIFNYHKGSKDKEYYFAHGGRWYGHWIQALYNKRADDNGDKIKLRDYLLIDGKKTVELDYSCLHANMLYAATNVTPMYEKDAYTIEENPILEEEGLRDLCKLAMLIVFNADDREEAIKAFRIGIKDSNKRLPYQDTEQINAIFDGLMRLHEPIKDFFFSGIGIKLQNIDSHIITNILKLFMEKGKPCISIHDSAIVLKEDEELLRTAMLEEYQKTLKTNQTIGIK